MVSLLFLFSLFVTLSPLKILVYNGKFAYSHVMYMGRIADLLVEAGHDVTVLLGEMDPAITANGSTLAKIHSYPSTHQISSRLTHSGAAANAWNSSYSDSDQLKLLLAIIHSNRDQGFRFIRDKKLAHWVKEQKFDMAISELINNFMFGVFKAWEIETTVGVSATPIHETHRKHFGLTFPSSIVPGMTQGYADTMTYMERLKNTVGYAFIEAYFFFDFSFDFNAAFKKHYPTKKIDFRHEIGEVSFVCTNTHPYIDTPQSMSPKFLDVGGLVLPTVNPLSQEWIDILSLRKKNVILSFGSIVTSKATPKDIKFGLLEAFKQFPDVTFIYKVDKDDTAFAKDYPNVVLSPWIPQNDLLGSHKIDVFLTHGGLNSLQELSHYGVVALTIPFFGDQHKNSKLIERAGAGLTFKKEDLSSPHKLVKLLQDLLYNKIYKQKATRLASMIADRPFTSKEIFLKHVAFAGKYGKLPELDLASRKLTFIQFYLLDIILPVLSGVLLFLYIIYRTFVFTIGLFRTFAKLKSD
uniref:Glucuronosyltransferase n=1 Tax=Rhabditophanes sp. KR3021 TaxID=114890 RepID=A0AC35U239_9BILA